MFWIKVPANNNSLNCVNEILKKFDEYGLEEIKDEPVKKDEYGLMEKHKNQGENKEKGLKYGNYKNTSKAFFENEELFIFFMEHKIEILLRKDSDIFNQLKQEFLIYFEV